MATDPPASRGGRVSVVVPVYDAVGTLAALDDRISSAFARPGWELEIVYVDDHSADGSRAVLEGLEARPGRCVVRLPEHRGQHGALIAGFAAASGAAIVTLDDDLQHPPESAVAPCAAVLDGEVDLVYLTPDPLPSSAVRRWASASIRRVLGVALGRSMGAVVSPFRVFDARLTGCLVPADRTAPSVDLLIGRAARTYAATTFPVGGGAEEGVADAGRSRYTLLRLLVLASRMTWRAVGIRVRCGRGTAVEHRLVLRDPLEAAR